MRFTTLQDDVRAAIAAHATFSTTAATNVVADLGHSLKAIETALDASTPTPGPGWVVAVMPPTKGEADGEYGPLGGCLASIVVRIGVNPTILTSVDAAHAADNTNPTAGAFVSGLVQDAIAAVLGMSADAGEVMATKLAADAIELFNFDEGLLAYHLRFQRFVVFGS